MGATVNGVTERIPSHDRYGQVFSLLNPAQFQAAFLSWVQLAFEHYGGCLLAALAVDLRLGFSTPVITRYVTQGEHWVHINGYPVRPAACKTGFNYELIRAFVCTIFLYPISAIL